MPGRPIGPPALKEKTGKCDRGEAEGKGDNRKYRRDEKPGGTQEPAGHDPEPTSHGDQDGTTPCDSGQSDHERGDRASGYYKRKLYGGCRGRSPDEVTAQNAIGHCSVDLHAGKCRVQRCCNALPKPGGGGAEKHDPVAE